MSQDKQKILIIAGASGSGKNTIREKLLANCVDCVRLTTATTRVKRDGEISEKDYYFLTKEKFLTYIKDGTIPEYWHAEDTDRYYGTYLPDIEKKGTQNKIILAQVQAEGIKYFKNKYDTLAILITAESDDELKERIVARDNISQKELAERMGLIDKEINEFKDVCDYTIENKHGEIDETVDKILTILKEKTWI